jgi:hypothetical protein
MQILSCSDGVLRHVELCATGLELVSFGWQLHFAVIYLGSAHGHVLHCDGAVLGVFGLV